MVVAGKKSTFIGLTSLANTGSGGGGNLNLNRKLSVRFTTVVNCSKFQKRCALVNYELFPLTSVAVSLKWLPSELD